jgi:ATP-dependent helicase HrpA
MDEQGELTKTGRQLGKLPCDPRVGRMLLEASERQCLAEVVIIAAALETQDVRQRPAGQRPQADQAHQRFLDPHSDFLDYIRLWDYYDRLRAELGRSRLQKALGQTFLSYQGFREWSDIVRQLKELLTAAGIDSGGRRYRLPDLDLQQIQAEQSELAEQRQPRNSRSGHSARTAPKRSLERPAGYAAIHQSLLSGLLSGIARRGERGDYQASGGLTIALWPGSGLFRRRPLWIMAAEIVETSKRYGRTVAEVDVEWIESAAGELLNHSYSDPHWSSKTGSAMVVRRSTLYGLPIVTDRKVGLASVDREAARDMLIEHGLVGGEWTCREAFYLHNLELLADMHELAQRTRSREYILDRFHLSAFYSQRLPSQLHDLNSLRAWLRAHQGTPEERGLWMNSDDLLRGSEEKTSFELEFPNALRIDSTELPLTYHFEPGHTADGVSLTLPQAALRQVSDDVLGWLVPGMLEEKILFLIRSLPKNLRTSFVPAPDVAKHLCEQLNKISRQQPFNAALCEVMSRHAGERITPSCFAVEKLPDHLHFLIRVVDDQGALIATGRQLGELQSKCLPTASTLDEATTAVDDDWTNRTVTPTDFESFPTQVIVRRGGLAVAAFPALVDLGDRVELRLADTLSEAERISRQGLTRLLALKHHRTLRNQVTHLPNYTAASVRIAYLMQAKERSQELTNQLQDLIARMALVEGQAPITQREDFEARNALATSRISVATQEVAAWLPKLAEQMHQVRLLTESAPLSWKEVFDDIAVQLVHLVHPNFLKETPWQWLAEYPRYLQAINLRVEKLKSGGLPKDRKLREPIEAAWAFHQELVARGRVQSPDFQPRLEELRWTIEELRVSIFAQQLGTKISVSPKRVQSIIEALKSQL